MKNKQTMKTIARKQQAQLSKIFADEASHTPGPWHTGADAGSGRGSIFADEGRMRLEKGGTTLYPIAVLADGWDEEEDLANAALISAAPELLEALNHAVVLLKFAFDDPSLLESQLAHETGALMTDALKKANGLEDEA